MGQGKKIQVEDSDGSGFFKSLEETERCHARGQCLFLTPFIEEAQYSLHLWRQGVFVLLRRGRGPASSWSSITHLVVKPRTLKYLIDTSLILFFQPLFQTYYVAMRQSCSFLG